MRLEMLTEATINASALIIAILIIRKVFEAKLNPNVRYFIWVFVAFRILIPVNMEFSLPYNGWINESVRLFTAENDSDSSQEKVQTELQTVQKLDLDGIPNAPIGVNVNELLPTEDIFTDQTSIKTEIPIEKLTSIIWVFGMVCMAGYTVINNIKLYVGVRSRRRQIGLINRKISVYELDGDNFLLGIFHPAIYMSPQVCKTPELNRHVVLHELQHYKAKDNLWVLVRTICLILQWYNPLIWVAYLESGRDCELACDYRVVRAMNKEERLVYGESLLSILRLNVMSRKGVYLTTSMGEDKKFMKKRLEGIVMVNHKKLMFIPSFIILLVGVVTFIHFTIQNDSTLLEENKVYNNNENEVHGQNLDHKDEGIESEETVENLKIDIEISDYYSTNIGDPSNLYYIDDQQILWGCGRNEYGQLGQGTQDYDFHEDMIKIAENVIHVDYSQSGFVIYITNDNKLYGFGNGGKGALQQLSTFSWEQYINGEHYAVTEPVLLMEDVIYAKCGQGDIAALKNDSSVWSWGTIWYQGDGNYYYLKIPMKILDNVALITGGWFNHAALLEDGTVWTWGYNYSGNCGFANQPVVTLPQKVAEDVTMVWTGSLKYNVDCYDITEFNGINERQMENTIIQKVDGSRWICGANVGNEEKIIPKYYETVDYEMICTHEFLPYDN